MLISLHLPKTAGTSFLALLREHFADRVLEDYADMPLHHAPATRRIGALRAAATLALGSPRLARVECIHGHFLPVKYRFLRGAGALRFVTWLRDPVERLASHYYYWLQSFDEATAGPLHRRVVREAWDLERFCFAPELRNVYAQFLWGVPLSRFEFVGISEHFDRDVRQFSERYLGGREIPPAQNVNTRRGAGADGEPRAYVTDPALRAAIEQFHARDMQLYRQALAQGDQRRA